MIRCVIFCTFFLVSHSLFADDSDPETVEEGKSFVGIVYDNAQSWTSYDVLMISTKASLDPNGVLIDQEIVERLALDKSSGRMLFLQTSKTIVKDPELPSKKVDNKQTQEPRMESKRHATETRVGEGFRLNGLVIDDQKRRFYINRDRSVASTDRSPLQLFGDQRVPNLSVVGLFDMRDNWVTSGRFNELYTQVVDTADSCSVQHGVGNVTVRFRHDSPGYGYYDYVWKIDSDLLLPTQVAENRGVKRFDKTTEMPWKRFDFEWEEVDGTVVPKSILGTERAYMETGEMGPGNAPSVKSYEIASEVRFHWFSVNQTIDSDLFRKEVLGNPSEISRLLETSVISK